MGTLMRYMPFVLLAAGCLGASSFIIAKKPDARKLIDKIAPYQAFMGIALMFFAVYNMFVWIGVGDMLKAFKWPIYGVTLWGVIGSSLLLGFLFGLPQVAKWSAAGAAKGEIVAKKLAPLQTILGFIAIGSSTLWILFIAGVLKWPGA